MAMGLMAMASTCSVASLATEDSRLHLLLLFSICDTDYERPQLSDYLALGDTITSMLESSFLLLTSLSSWLTMLKKRYSGLL